MSATSATRGEALAFTFLLALLACSGGGGGPGGVRGTAGGGDGAVGGTAPDPGLDGGTGTPTPPPSGGLHAISGAVSGGSGDVELALTGTNVQVLGASALLARPGSGGIYRFGALPDGEYVLFPEGKGLAFTPPRARVTVSGRDVTGVDFAASAVGASLGISGTVSGAAPDGNSLQLHPAPVFQSAQTVTTADGGGYAFTGLDPGEYLLRPFLEGSMFTPPDRLVEVGAADVSGQDFTQRIAPVERRFEPICRDGWCWETPQPQGNVLSGVWGSSARDVWAVGWDVLLHWDGDVWSAYALASPGDAAALENRFEAVWGSSEDDVWAVGGSIRHWDGRGWSTVPSGFTGVGQLALTSIWGSSADDVWAVGGWIVLHWDGRSWSTSPTPVGTSLQALWGSAADDVWAAGSGGQTLHWDGRSWSPVPTPMAGLGAFAAVWDPNAGVWLTDLWGSAADDVWAAGSNGVVLHWNGAAWSAVPTPAGWWTQHAAVWGSSAKDAWIVGDLGALHWDGAAWSSASLPAVNLNGMWGSAADDVWAIGNGGQMLHWDGAAWSRTPSRLFAPELTGVWVHDDADAWAVDEEGSILHWDGCSWTRASHPAKGLRAIWGSAGDDVWAVGAGALHWDGRSWSAVPAPPGSDPRRILTAVFGTSGSDVWAVGYGEVWHWDGAAWSSAPAPSLTFTGVWASAPDDAWATASGGVTYNPDFPAMAHWDGKTWTTVTDRATAGYLNGVWGSSARDVWAVGDGGRILHFDGTAWMPVGGAQDDLYAVWGSGPNDVWAVGGRGGGAAVGFVNFGGAVLHWDGSAWTEQVTPFGPPSEYGGGRLAGVSGSPSGQVWAVGEYRTILRHQR